MTPEDKFFNILNNTKEPAFDVETNGLDWKRCHVCGYSISNGSEAVYIPVRHSSSNIEHVDRFESRLARDICSHPGKIVGHNIKFDAHFSQNHAIYLGNKQICTMVNEALLDENRRSYSLENVAKTYDIEPKKGKELYEHISKQFGCKSTRDSMGHFHRLAGNDPLAVEYAAGDTLSTYQLYQAQKKEIYRQELDTIWGVESELTHVLQKMERRGIRVCPEATAEVKHQIDDMLIEAYDDVPMVDSNGEIKLYNVRSGKDLKEYFELCEIDDWPMTAPTKTHPNGQPSFKQDWLSLTPEGIAILNVRKLSNLKSMFLDRVDDHIYNSKIHTTFNQTRGETHGTRTGRLSSNYPNMQQIPKRDEQIGKIYRSIFVPGDNYIHVEFDYSQAEPRLYSHYSGEPSLLKGYTSQPYVDMHSVAAEYMNVKRSVAKNLNLGMMYTMGAAKLATKLGIPYEEALAIVKRWHRTFPRVSGFTKKAETVGRERHYVKTILGRRKRFDHPDYCYRAANAIIQGGSADILKYKMVEIDRWIEANHYDEVVRMILTIHDSILFEVHKDYQHLIKEIKQIMENVQSPPFNLRVPFIADGKWGINWSDATYGSNTIY